MNKRKRQHYVPQFYLRNFVRDDKNFTILNINSQSIIENVPYKKQCYEDYYYGEDEKWEVKLGEIESAASIIIRKINEGNEYFPNLEEINILKKYILYQRYRTVSNKENISNLQWNATKILLEMELNKENKYISPQILENLRKNFEKEHGDAIPQMALDITSHLIDKIYDLELIILNYNNQKHKLISSDNPVILYNSFYKRALGLTNAGLIIMLPINSNKMILLIDTKMYPRYKGKKIINLTNENEVRMLNVFQLISSNKIVYLKDKNQATLILSDLKKYQEERSKFKKLGEGQTMGPENEKILAFSQAFIPINYQFSFSKVHSKGKGFIENEIDWFTREKNVEYENRMLMRPQILKITGILKGKFRKNNIKNVEKFNKFVYDYWNNRL